MSVCPEKQVPPDGPSQASSADQCDKIGQDEPVILPITDCLDLHLFRSREIPALLDDYLDECLKRSIGQVRLIHGKGTGVLRERVHSLLRKDPRVASFHLAPPEAGGWGATVVELLTLNPLLTDFHKSKPSGPPAC